MTRALHLRRTQRSHSLLTNTPQLPKGKRPEPALLQRRTSGQLDVQTRGLPSAGRDAHGSPQEARLPARQHGRNQRAVMRGVGER